MKARLLLFVLAVSGLVMIGSLRAADEKPSLEKVTCPVSGKAVTAEFTVKYEGAKVYFCCENCPKAFAKDTKKFATKANHQLVLTGQAVQVACPISGEEVDEEVTVEVAGVKVAMCCEKCEAKAKKTTGNEQLELIFASFTKGFTTQTKCPVSDKAIDPVNFVKHDGKKVYFCCDNCPKAFQKDPSKYAAKLK